MEARYVEAGSMSIFWTQNRALKTTSLARVPIPTWLDLVGPSSSLQRDPNRARWDPAGGSQLFSTWDPNRVRWDAVGPGAALLYVGPCTPFGFHNVNEGEGRPHDNHFHCPLAL